MPSGQNLASRLREETSRALAEHLLSFQEEFRTLQADLSASLSSIQLLEGRLTSSQGIDIAAIEAILAGALAAAEEESTRKRDAERSAIALFAHEIRFKETQEEILNALLDGAHRYAPRVMLFVARGSQVLGWSSRGLSEEAAQNLSRKSLSSSDSPLLRNALDANGLTTAADVSRETAIAEFLADGKEGPWHALPLKAIQRPAAVLLAVATPERACDLESLCILMDLTGLCIENMALKILQELKVAKPPSAAPPVDQEVQSPASDSIPSAIDDFSESRSEEAPCGEEASLPPPVPPVSEEIAAVESTPEPGVESAQEEPELEAAAPAPDHVDLPAAEAVAPVEEVPEAIPEPELPPQELAPEAAPPAAEPPLKEAEVEEETEKIEPARAPALREVQPLTEEEKLHAEAKRFARLLASEIKLYNEQRVREGRANRDLYVRLKRDIDRSRDMYEKRISPVVSRRVDYFHDEVIRILGDNDPSALGSDYPGPRVES